MRSTSCGEKKEEDNNLDLYLRTFPLDFMLLFTSLNKRLDSSFLFHYNTLLINYILAS